MVCITLESYAESPTACLGLLSTCLISKESWFPYTFDPEKVPFVDGFKVNKK